MRRVVRGTIHQGDACFSADSLGRQCTAIAAVAGCSLLLRDPESWTSADVDDCVRTGDRLYHQSVRRRAGLARGLVNPAEDAVNREYLGVDELHRVAPLRSGDVPFTVDTANTMFGNLTGWNDLMNLETGLVLAFVEHRAVLLTTCDYTICLLYQEGDVVTYLTNITGSGIIGMKRALGSFVEGRYGHPITESPQS